MNVDGSNDRQVSPDGYWGRYPSWAPSGRKFSYGVEPGSDTGPGTGTAKIATLRTDGTDFKLFSLEKNQGAIDPAYSPEGGRFICVSVGGGTSWNNQLCLMSSDGTNATPIDGTEGDVAFPAWSPEGDRVVARRTTKVSTDHKGLWRHPYRHLVIFNVDSSGETNLSTGEEAIDWDPFWSPSGSLVAFSSTETQHGLMELWLVRANNGTKRTRLTVCDGEFGFNRGLPRGDWYPMWFGK